ncbi:MAG: hypothetical protein R2856_34760 [Caldilineaceae bacterium]
MAKPPRWLILAVPRHRPGILPRRRRRPYDYGDLPDGVAGSADYPALFANGGPNHVIGNKTYLGGRRRHRRPAQRKRTGDDINSSPDDEGGVVFTAPLVPGTTVNVQITTVTGDGSGALSSVDFNGDGDFADAGEVILSDSVVNDGVQTVAVNATGAFGVRVLAGAAGEGGNIPGDADGGWASCPPWATTSGSTPTATTQDGQAAASTV